MYLCHLELNYQTPLPATASQTSDKIFDIIEAQETVKKVQKAAFSSMLAPGKRGNISCY